MTVADIPERSAPAIRHPLLEACGVDHGFGVRGAVEPQGCVRPRQVHGTRVMHARRGGGAGVEEADAIVSDVARLPVAVVTADCVPILVAARDGRCVAAIHAGWRGLAAGVIRAGLEALIRSGVPPSELHAVIGPRIGSCCYEVDTPVIDALRARFGRDANAALLPVDADHALADLGALARLDCLRAGLAPDAVACLEDACTRRDAARFHSYRRDGARSGRLLHFVIASGYLRLDNPGSAS